MSKMYMKYGSSMKSFKLRVCVRYGGNEEIFHWNAHQ